MRAIRMPQTPKPAHWPAALPCASRSQTVLLAPSGRITRSRYWPQGWRNGSSSGIAAARRGRCTSVGAVPAGDERAGLEERHLPLVFIIMGVAGCGKSTVGRLLADRLAWPFYEADDFHPPANVAKMRAGTPLDDADRWPWLEQLAGIVQRHMAQGTPAVLSCSALTPEYRHVLRTGLRAARGCDASDSGGSDGSGAADPVAFVLLQPPAAVLQSRLKGRAAAGTHYMPPSLLASQLAALRYDPSELYMCFAGEAAVQPPADIADAILRHTGL